MCGILLSNGRMVPQCMAVAPVSRTNFSRHRTRWREFLRIPNVRTV